MKSYKFSSAERFGLTNQTTSSLIKIISLINDKLITFEFQQDYFYPLYQDFIQKIRIQNQVFSSYFFIFFKYLQKEFFQQSILITSPYRLYIVYAYILQQLNKKFLLLFELLVSSKKCAHQRQVVYIKQSIKNILFYQGKKMWKIKLKKQQNCEQKLFLGLITLFLQNDWKKLRCVCTKQINKMQQQQKHLQINKGRYLYHQNCYDKQICHQK
ncbi:hypothetical protein TTHERM_000079059 (macronuclear) [Tetrahymena thermophila SB210]|uniref:Uncharacterized protein n=1 Tax=Tetrahymena thermophila (strain SB210) TaxID=312017 RepID=W7XAS4_TETTS|nr:hypothetical protein TTHERM_000079059 [Tetrahymena thermophila SB210]EWS74452.1 hypothetical protein TTHERM_000079059 [Tetrahymena thermophila SB210]|eukprot:XP_012653029.1 hypothetical protein TTHERM_000079059 [Tetrahymena thermophila SB210]